jgi:hypothetical protein
LNVSMPACPRPSSSLPGFGRKLQFAMDVPRA